MKKLRHYLKEILITLVIVTTVLNAVSYYRSQTLNKEPFPLHNIKLNDQAIMIHFWATWCPVCKVEAPNIQKISESFNVVTIAVESGSDQEIQKYLRSNNYHFKVINDQNSKHAQQFNIKVFPTTLIYDKDKKLIFSEVGYTSTFGLYLRMWWANL